MKIGITRIVLFIPVFAGLLFPGAAHSQSSVLLDIQESQGYMRAGQYEKAIAVLNVAVQKEPYNAQLYYLRGFSKYGLDDFIGAELDFSRAIAISPYRQELFLLRADVRSQQRNFGGALDDLYTALKTDSSNADIYFSLARIKLYLKKYFASLADCNRAIKLGYDQEAVYILRGSAAFEIDRYENALADFRKAIEINPGNPYAYIQAGALYMEQGNPDSALLWYNRVLSFDTANVYALFNRSLAFIKKKDHPAALADLDRVIRLSPYNSYAYFNRAIVYNEIKQYDRAIHDFDYVIRLNPKNINSYYFRALLKAETRDYRGALADLDRTIELYPENAEAWYQRYQIKLQLKDRAGAQNDYNRAMEIGRKKNLPPDSLSVERKTYLESLVTLSGDFEMMNDPEGRLQNRPVEIRPMPLFFLFPGKADFSLVRLYDTYRRPHYHSSIISLTPHRELIGDSLCRKLTEGQRASLDSMVNPASWYLNRAICSAASRRFNDAFVLFDTLLQIDSGFVLAYFCRAGARYELIRLIGTLNDYQKEITIGSHTKSIEGQVASAEVEHTYDEVVRDLDRAILLDPEFPYAWYNRGVIHTMTGDYITALNDFSKAVELKNGFAEAFYNRGLIRILMDDRASGCEDLSHAGELGITDAYKVMKRYCFK